MAKRFNLICAIFTTGFTIGALVNNTLRMASASYKGEYYAGYMYNGNPHTDTTFKIYKVKRGDNQFNNPDVANWGLMVPFGAPFVDVNNNGVYDVGIDIPGVFGAEQTLFLCMTDGFAVRHDSSEGFGGGTLPLNAEIHMTAWAYNNTYVLRDIQFIKYVIINKCTNAWTQTFSGVINDPDLGVANDDYIGCDTANKLNLGYVYNATNNDAIYGIAPPSSGMDYFKNSVMNRL